MKANQLTHEIIGAAIEVHRELGPGKAEAAYEHALVHELSLRDLAHQVQKAVPVVYKGVKLECGYRLDLLVADAVVVEVKSVELLNPVHRAQVLTYLKLGGWRLALLLNFNVAVLKDGLERLVLGFEEDGKETAETRQTQRGIISRSEPVTFACAMHCGNVEAEAVAGRVLAAATEVFRALGPGLLPSAYEICLCHELHLRGIPFTRKQSLPLSYKGVALPTPDEVELLVAGCLVVHPRALREIRPVHEAELLSQLRLGRWPLGLLINFNCLHLAEGIRRLALTSKRTIGGSG